MNRLLSVFCISICFFALSRGAIVRFGDKLTPNTYISLDYGMYTEEDKPFGNQQPYMEFNMTMGEVEMMGDKRIQVILYHSDLVEYIGKEIEGTEYLCCWQEVYEVGECNNLGEALIQDEAFSSQYSDRFYFYNVEWTNLTSGNTSQIVSVNTPLEQRIGVSVSGMWRLEIINCGINMSEAEGDGISISLNGSAVFYNPYGHLPAGILGFMPLYFILALLYLGTGIWWAILCYMHRADLLYLQQWIGFVFAAGFFENTIFFADYVTYNHLGLINLGFNLMSVFASVAKRTLSYVALLLVANGYTIITPTMTKKQKAAVVILGTTYLVISGIYQFIAMFRYTPQTYYLNVSAGAEYLFLILVSILNIIILIWIFASLIRSMKLLLEKKQEEKLKLFKKVTFVLVSAYLVSLIFYIIQVSVVFADYYDRMWNAWWVWDGYWSALYYFIAFILGFICRPTGKNKDYAFATQLTDDPRDAVDLPDIKVSEKEDKEDKKSKDGSSDSD